MLWISNLSSQPALNFVWNHHQLLLLQQPVLECLIINIYDNFFGLSVVLITGGYNGGFLRSAEIFNPVTKTRCSLPQLPEGRNHHSEDGGLACGGGSAATQTTCVKWSPASGTWTKSHTLRQNRSAHVSWATASGVYLIGGSFSKRTSEKVKLDGSVEEGFSLKYDTRLHSEFH